MFRVMGKGRPESVRPYMEILQLLAESDPNPVVRIHSAGAIRITSEETPAIEVGVIHICRSI